MVLRSFHWGLVGSLPMILMGCQSLPTTPINQISHARSTSQSPASGAVKISGQVISIAPMVGQVAYEVQDATGRIWVLSRQLPPPQPNSMVTVTGTVQATSIVINGEDLGEVYLEAVGQQ
ncbi:hypothetical protein [Alkalinema sp. FACHB-956]|uniref:hypothetical protein n=1 Tax=Alkalinema sp. FACHB-956 TaxID=2692768 RepID=UPI001687DEED|nr:hypothetical protein [Alkalinema sp. FACHB-956]MBD2329506.1 hypothetical protein [Alkalinema sp. FACHB-956]